jgi:nucleoside-diphosphate-sugar epimerase
MDPSVYYGIAKLHSEARHRAMKDFRIIDLRISSYFSRFIDLNAKFLMGEVVSCILHRRKFVTDPDDIVRDYIHPDDLYSLVKLCIDKRDLNDAFDVSSLQPVRKFDIIERFSSLFGLHCTINGDDGSLSTTGKKKIYYSTNHGIKTIGFVPLFTSLDSVLQESKAIMESN